MRSLNKKLADFIDKHKSFRVNFINPAQLLILLILRNTSEFAEKEEIFANTAPENYQKAPEICYLIVFTLNKDEFYPLEF